jgi:hypothetical protein
MRKGTAIRREPLRVFRYGVSLPPVKAEVVDAIARFGERGATLEDLHREVYPGEFLVQQPRSLATIKTHISTINELFEECDVRIRCQGGRYRIVGPT